MARAESGERRGAIEALGTAEHTYGNLVPLRAGPQEKPGMESAAGHLDEAAAFG